MPPNVAEPNDQFKQFVTETAKSTLSPKRRVHQDWLDENQGEICVALEEKNKAFITWKNDPTSTSKRDCFKHLQSKRQKDFFQMQDSWLRKKHKMLSIFLRPTTRRCSSVPSSPSTDPPSLVPPPCFQQMVPHS